MSTDNKENYSEKLVWETPILDLLGEIGDVAGAAGVSGDSGVGGS